MSTPKAEKPLRTTRTSSGAMWCESCNRTTLAEWTKTQIFKNGKEIETQLCSDCGATQETEYFKGPSIRIRNKE